MTVTEPRGLWVKICGLTTADAIEAAAGAGVQAVGFVFHEGSPRNLDVEAAAALQRSVPRDVERVAVFLHPAQSLVDAVLARVRPDWVQLDAADVAELRLPPGQRVLQVLRSGAALPHPLPARFLLESPRSGAGEAADWVEAAGLATRAELVLAGGLSAANVAAAVRQVRPFGVDVSSGVESRRGVKDPARIREFVAAARAAHASLAAHAIEETSR